MPAYSCSSWGRGVGRTRNRLKRMRGSFPPWYLQFRVYTGMRARVGAWSMPLVSFGVGAAVSWVCCSYGGWNDFHQVEVSVLPLVTGIGVAALGVVVFLGSLLSSPRVVVGQAGEWVDFPSRREVVIAVVVAAISYEVGIAWTLIIAPADAYYAKAVWTAILPPLFGLYTWWVEQRRG